MEQSSAAAPKRIVTSCPMPWRAQRRSPEGAAKATASADFSRQIPGEVLCRRRRRSLFLRLDVLADEGHGLLVCRFDQLLVRARKAMTATRHGDQLMWHLVAGQLFCHVQR